MFGYYPVRNSPLPYSYSPFSYHPLRPSLDLERERYMRALAEEQAARDSYTSALAREREIQEAAAARHAQAEALRRQHLREQQRRSHHLYASPYASRYANSSDEEYDYPYAPYNHYNSVGSPYDDNQNVEMPDEFEAYKLKELLKKKELEKLMNETIRDRRLRELNEKDSFFINQKRQRDEDIPRKQRVSPTVKAASATRSPSTSVRIPISDPEPIKSTSSQSQQTAKAKASSREPSPDPIDHQVHAARLAALTTIDALRTQFTSLKNVFVFPTSLDFATASSPSAVNESPRLAYTHTNAPFHAYEDALLKLLQALDAVESAGEREVREKRREMVKNVEAELALLDVRKVETWRRVCEAAAPVEEKMEVDSRQSAEVEEKAVDEIDVLISPADEASKMEVEDKSAYVVTEPPVSTIGNNDTTGIEQSVRVQVMEVGSQDSSESQKMDEDDVVAYNTDIEVEAPSNPTSTVSFDESGCDQREDDYQALQHSSTSQQLDISTLASTSEPSSPRPAYVREVLAPTSLSEPSSSRPYSPAFSTSSVVQDLEVYEESTQSATHEGQEDLIVVEETSSNPDVDSVQQSSSSSLQDSISTYPPQAIYPTKVDESEHDNYVMVF